MLLPSKPSKEDTQEDPFQGIILLPMIPSTRFFLPYKSHKLEVIPFLSASPRYEAEANEVEVED